MIVLSKEVMDLEMENSSLDLDEELATALDEDPLFGEFVMAGIGALVSKLTDDLPNHIKLEDASRVLQEFMYGTRYLYRVQADIDRLQENKWKRK